MSDINPKGMNAIFKENTKSKFTLIRITCVASFSRELLTKQEQDAEQALYGKMSSALTKFN
jgi:hypothetical protein